MRIVLPEDLDSQIDEIDMDALGAFLSDFVDWDDVEYLEDDSEAPEGSEED